MISSVGTRGTITGVTKYIKHTKIKKKLINISVESYKSAVITQFLSGKELNSGLHKIKGIGPGFIPKNLNLKLIDQVVTVTSEESILMTQKLMKTEGILAGISSGATLCAALKM